MNHLVVLPVVLPLLAAAVLLVTQRGDLAFTRGLSLCSSGALLLIGLGLLQLTGDGPPLVYYVGDWPAPYGIVLVADRLSALMVTLTALLAFLGLLYATAGEDTAGAYFHPLYQFQLAGLGGAFLTGDLFNLFVFFEILLIASYCLLLHGGGSLRARAGLHFVVLNLAGSALFLFALGTIYASLGTLNMVDLALKSAEATPEQRFAVRAGVMLLLAVFGLKAALLPLGFWLPDAYAAACAPVAALFAVMTKVGIYAIMRVHVLVFGGEGGIANPMTARWLLPLALGTVVIGTIGMLASRELRRTMAYLVVVSVGTALCSLSLLTREALAATTFYLVHSTLIGGGLFLLADLVARQRGEAADALDRAQAVAQPLLLGALFFVGVVAAAGLPPFSGFLAKLFILRAALPAPSTAWVWAVLLVTSLFVVIALSRGASAIFWRTEGTTSSGPPVPPVQLVATIGLLASAGLITAFAGPLSELADSVSGELLDVETYARQVLANATVAPTASGFEGVR